MCVIIWQNPFRWC